jgi:hypothetical protein
MARTPAQAKALETKALAEENKSAGMRTLLEAGYTVQEVRDIFGVPYGFVYGVAKRAGLVVATPRAPKAEKPKAAPKAKPAAKPAAKAPAAKPAAKAPAKTTRRRVATKA